MKRKEKNLADNVTIGDANNEAVLVRVVLVLVLAHHGAASNVISLAFAATAETSLEALEVRLVLDDLDERHFR